MWPLHGLGVGGGNLVVGPGANWSELWYGFWQAAQIGARGVAVAVTVGLLVEVGLLVAIVGTLDIKMEVWWTTQSGRQLCRGSGGAHGVCLDIQAGLKSKTPFSKEPTIYSHL